MSKELLQVIRIEDAQGIGYFRSPNIHIPYNTEIFVRHKKFHTPSQDGLNMYKDGKQWYCAYKSIEQIQQWIHPEEFAYLIEKGFKIKLFTVSNYQIGEHQVVFTKGSIKSRKTISKLFL